MFSALGAKRLELLHELAPNVGVIGMLVNPNVPDTETQLRDAQEAARALGLKLRIVNASTGDEIATAFGALVRQEAGALLVGADPFLTSRIDNSSR